MALSGHGYGSSDELQVSIKTASGFKLCDVHSHTSTDIECVSSPRPRMTEYQCQTGVYLDRRFLVDDFTTDSALECMSKCTSMSRSSPSCQSLMWNSAHNRCFLSSAPQMTTASSGCDSSMPDLGGGNDECCSINNPCNIDEGRCNSHDECRAGLWCYGECSFNEQDDCCSDREGSEYEVSSWMTCSNPSVVLDEAIVTCTRKIDRRQVAKATFGMEWNNDMSPVIEQVVTTSTVFGSQVQSCATLGWLTKMGLPVCGLVVDLENDHYTPVDDLYRESSPSHDDCPFGSMIDGTDDATGTASWCAREAIKYDLSWHSKATLMSLYKPTTPFSSSHTDTFIIQYSYESARIHTLGQRRRAG